MLSKMLRSTTLIWFLGIALPCVLAQEPYECTEVTIANEYRNGTTTVVGIDIASLDLLDNEQAKVVMYNNFDTSSLSMSVTCDGQNVITTTVDPTGLTLAGTCNGNAGIAGPLDVSYFYVPIASLFSDAVAPDNDGTFVAVYQPKCVVTLNSTEVSTVEKQYTVYVENDLIVSVTTTANPETVGLIDNNDVELSSLASVILDNPSVTLRDGEMTELQFNLQGADANINQDYFQILDISGLTIEIGSNMYVDTDLVLYTETDTAKGRTVKFIVPTTAFTENSQAVNITGTASVGLSDELLATRRRSADAFFDPAEVLSHGDTTQFAFTVTADAEDPSPSTSESSAHTTAVSATAVLASFIARL